MTIVEPLLLAVENHVDRGHRTYHFRCFISKTIVQLLADQAKLTLDPIIGLLFSPMQSRTLNQNQMMSITSHSGISIICLFVMLRFDDTWVILSQSPPWKRRDDARLPARVSSDKPLTLVLPLPASRLTPHHSRLICKPLTPRPCSSLITAISAGISALRWRGLAMSAAVIASPILL